MTDVASDVRDAIFASVRNVIYAAGIVTEGESDYSGINEMKEALGKLGVRVKSLHTDGGVVASGAVELAGPDVRIISGALSVSNPRAA